MASFEGAVENTLLWEGDYSNDPHDSGGETYRGISRANWPSWAGWTIVDCLKSDLCFPGCLDANTQLSADVLAFYRKNFWLYGGVVDQAVANKIFDLAVNVGQVHAHRIVQHVVGDREDGIWGPQTERSVNSFTPNNGSLLIAIRLGAADYHQEIAHTHPEDAVFLAGWLRRDRA